MIVDGFLKGMITLASFNTGSGSWGGGLGELFSAWDRIGFFDLMLPILLIFCLVYITLQGLKIFKEDKKISTVIAIAVALMAVQFPYVSYFFAEVFPRVGIGLGILLVIFIFWGLFFDKNANWQKIMMIIIGGIIAVFVLYNSAQAFGWGLFGGDLAPFIIDKLLPAAVLIGLIAIAVASGKPKDANKPPMKIALSDDD